jgi:hypothetical protein
MILYNALYKSGGRLFNGLNKLWLFGFLY